MTDDMYRVVMAMTPKHSDLRVVKQLGYDSIESSLLTAQEKAEATEVFERAWDDAVSKLTSKPRNRGQYTFAY